MGYIKHKLKSRRGETLVETLVALVIVAMASALLLTMISTASRLNTIAMQNDAEIFAEADIAQRQQGAGNARTVQVTIRATDQPKEAAALFTLPVDWYGGAEKIASYRLSEGGRTP